MDLELHEDKLFMQFHVLFNVSNASLSKLCVTRIHACIENIKQLHVAQQIVIEYDSRYILNIMYSSFSVVISTLLLLYTVMTIHLNELIL